MLLKKSNKKEGKIIMIKKVNKNKFGVIEYSITSEEDLKDLPKGDTDNSVYAVDDNNNIKINSFIYNDFVWNNVIPEYIILICTIMINIIIMINTLLSFKCARIFRRWVLALNELNTAIKINNVKKAVIICSLVIIFFIMGSFRNNKEIINVYIDDDIISLNIYLFMIFSSFFFGGSFIYSILGTS